MEQFSKPKQMTDIEAAFPVTVSHLMPAYADIPEEFKRGNHPFCQWQAKWFFEGLETGEVPQAREGINQPDAMRHLKAIQSSFEPKHEHKAAAVAYLASLWLEEPEIA